MKAFKALALGLLATASSVLSQSTTFAKVDGLKFNIDGATKYYPGTNSYWISMLMNNADVDLVLNNLRTSGLKILRIWGFNDVNQKPGANTVWFQYLSSSGSEINTGANGLQRLDYIVKAAEARGIKLIINFVNNWDDYGGMKAYTNAFGGTHEGWYTNARAQAQYRNYVRALVTRWKDSKTIFAWELGNEPRCKGCNTDVIYKWAKEASEFVKSLDSNHMVTLGDEGFGLPGGDSSTNYPYSTTEGVDFVKNLGISTLDFGTFHMYITGWGVTNAFGPGWIRAHAAACVKANKPCLYEEYGSTTDHCGAEVPWQQVSRTTTGIAADLFWQLGDTLSTGKTHNDGYTIYTNSADWKCMVTDHVAAINRGSG